MYYTYMTHMLKAEMILGVVENSDFIAFGDSFAQSGAYALRRDHPFAEDFRIGFAAISDHVLIEICKNYFATCKGIFR